MLQALLPEAVESVIAAGASWLLTYLIHSTILLGAAWLLDRRPAVSANPRLRSWLWTAAVVGGVVTATVSGLGGRASPVDLTVTEAEKAVLELYGARGTADTPSRAAGPGARSAGGASASRAPLRAARLMSPSPAELTSPTAWLRAAGHDWPYMLFLAFAAAATSVLAVRAWRLRRFLRRLGGRRTVASGPMRDILDELTRDRAEARAVSVSRSRALVSPVTLPGGEICVPDRVADGLEEGELRALLAHELAHLRRGDPALLLALAALEALLAVQPLNRLARLRLVAAIESRTDERVRRQGLGAELASTLVTVGRWMRGGRPKGPVAGLARESGLETRVRSLLAGPDVPAETSARVVPLAMGALLVAAGALAFAAPGMRVVTSPHAPYVARGAGGEGRPPVHCDSPFGSSPVSGPEDCSVRGGVPPEARRRLADGRGVGLYLEVEASGRPFRLRMRPGRTFVRVYGSSGRRLVLPMPRPERAPDGAVASLHLEAPAGEEHVVYLPPSVRRLTVVVNGRIVGSRSAFTGAAIPRLVVPAAGGTSATS